jgi:hydrogenase nickel incorporation protein HypB
MIIPVIRKVLEQNERAARENRRLFDTYDIRCANLLGGAGCGKTSLLEGMLPILKDSCRAAVLEGDLVTTRDAERINALGVPVVQLLTEGGCHLNATHVQQALERVSLDELDLLIIENVGNPICPAHFDLGEHLRIAVLSVAEGHDKPSKYPLLFKDAQLVVLTKCDLLPYVDFDPNIVQTDLHRINHTAELIRTDIKSGEGMDRLAQRIRGEARGSASAKSAVHKMGGQKTPRRRAGH